MKTPYLYLVKPLGDRYNNEKQIEGKNIIVNTTMDETDYKYTNRIGEVIALPVNPGPLEIGDKVIVHHNTFRKWFNVRGNIKEASAYIKEGHFYIGLDQLYAYNRGDGWVSVEDYCFIEPEAESNWMSTEVLSKNFGKVAITNPILEAQGVSVGDKVFFNETAAYKFEIDGKILYKMSAIRNVKLVL